MTTLKKFSPEWWQNKEVSTSWCVRFCKEFFEEDPTLKSNEKTFETIGVIFFNKPTGEIIPVGFTAIQDGKFIFQYHHSYLENHSCAAISETLPKQKERFISNKGDMLPFFDNLPAEGWFGKAQGAALGDEECKKSVVRDQAMHHHTDNETLDNRYHRFMMFGRDYPGAVWATYIRIDPHISEEHHQYTIEAALRSRSSIAGMQPKLLGVADKNGEIHPANFWETSTHIVKLPSAVYMPMLMEYEYMSIIATKALLSNDKCVDASLTGLHLRDGSTKEVLAIKRFDRTDSGEKIHFEEMNQLLSKQNSERYEGAYVDIADVIRNKIGHEGVKQFYARLLCQFMLGNTDNHLKNFALFHNNETGKWSMTPDYDLAPTVNYKKSSLALFATKHQISDFGGPPESRELYTNLNPRILVNMGVDFGLSIDEIKKVINSLTNNIEKAKQAVMNDPSPRLDFSAPLSEDSMRWHYKHGSSSKGNNRKSAREDFCDLIDGRAQKLFSSLDKYLAIRESKKATMYR